MTELTNWGFTHLLTSYLHVHSFGTQHLILLLAESTVKTLQSHLSKLNERQREKERERERERERDAYLDMECFNLLSSQLSRMRSLTCLGWGGHWGPNLNLRVECSTHGSSYAQHVDMYMYRDVTPVKNFFSQYEMFVCLHVQECKYFELGATLSSCYAHQLDLCTCIVITPVHIAMTTHF